MSLAGGSGPVVPGGEPLAAPSRGRRLPLLLALLVLAGAGVGGFALLRAGAGDEGGAPASGAADGGPACGPVETLPDAGAEHTPAPVGYSQVPATSGPHSPIALPPDVSVYPVPFTPELEWLAVHNLEHGYVLVYYRQGPLAPRLVSALADLATAEPEVILAPYPTLPADADLAFVAWTKLQQCPGGIESEEAVAVAREFIARFRNGPAAPESQAG